MTYNTSHLSDKQVREMLESILYLCTETDGTRGIWKRIDECRELFECIQEFAPELLERCIWIKGWLGYQYCFLTSMRQLLLLPENMLGMEHFPRPWVDLEYFNSLTEYLCKKSKCRFSK